MLEDAELTQNEKMRRHYTSSFVHSKTIAVLRIFIVQQSRLCIMHDDMISYSVAIRWYGAQHPSSYCTVYGVRCTVHLLSINITVVATPLYCTLYVHHALK
jgi:hypothetical protein